MAPPGANHPKYRQNVDSRQVKLTKTHDKLTQASSSKNKVTLTLGTSHGEYSPDNFSRAPPTDNFLDTSRGYMP